MSGCELRTVRAQEIRIRVRAIAGAMVTSFKDVIDFLRFERR